MAKPGKIKTLFAPLLEKYDDLFVAGRFVLIKPIRHFYLGLEFQPGNNLSYIWPNVVTTDLISGFGIGSSGWSKRLESPLPGLWEWNNPVMLEEVRRVFETDTLPYLRSITTYDDYQAETRAGSLEGFKMPHGVHSALLFAIAKGYLETARQIASDHIIGQVPAFFRGGFTYQPEYLAWMSDIRQLVPLLEANDIAGMAALLRRFEEQSVRQEKLEAYWQPTPFPLEMLA